MVRPGGGKVPRTSYFTVTFASTFSVAHIWPSFVGEIMHEAPPHPKSLKRRRSLGFHIYYMTLFVAQKLGSPTKNRYIR